MSPDTAASRSAQTPGAEKSRIALARKTPGMGLLDCVAQPDMKRMRAYRLERVRAELRKRDYAGVLLYDPINVRYATGSRNMAVWALHNATRYAYIPTEGPITLFDFHNCEHLSDGIETIDEVEPLGTHLLTEAGIEIFDGQEVVELARSIKSADEIACMSVSITACESGMAKMRAELRPGITENELWSHLHQVNIALGGEWIETRLLSSGGRTNPWFQESSDRIIRAGELVTFDTDLIGPYGYCSDLSRTFFCGPGRPSEEQKRLYGMAYEQIHTNLELLKPGLSYREFAEKSFKLPPSFAPNRYSVIFHGMGLADEYP